MRVGYLGAAAFGLGIMLAGAGWAVTLNLPPEASTVAGSSFKLPKIANVEFEAPETPPITDEPAPPNCAADGPGCQPFVPPGGNGDFGEIPLPPAVFLLGAGVAALFGLSRRRRSG